MNSAVRPQSLPLKTIFLLGSLIALGPLSIDMYLPAFPTIERSFGAASGSLQLTLATYFIGLALGQLFYGPISDRFGRKPPLYFGLSLFVFAAIGCAVSSGVTELAIWRFLQAVGGCACMVITMAIVRDRAGATETARTFSRLILVIGIAPVVAPLLGGWLLELFSWRAIFVSLALAGCLSLLAVHFGLRETRNPAYTVPLNAKEVLLNYGSLLRERSFIAYALLGAAAMTGMFAYISASPFVLIELYGVAPANFGWYFGANAAAFIASSQINARLVRTHGAARILHRSVLVPACAATMLALLSLLGGLWLPVLASGFFVYLGSLGLINPNSMALALAKQGHRAGTASAVLGAVQFTCATLAGAVMGMWHDGTAWPLTCVMAIGGLSALLVGRVLLPKQPA